MTLTEKIIQRLTEEGIPTYAMSENQLQKANEIVKELIEEEN